MGVYFINDNAENIEMKEQPFKAELILQELLGKHVNLLPGDQIDANNPRKWILIKRESGIPDAEGGSNRWSLDHLFLDNEAIPTLVEVKRSTDTRVRREVVAQMLDYAANAVVYWTSEEIQRLFYDRKDINPDEELNQFLGNDSDIEQFWEKVGIHLKEGKIRMVFVADEIPKELQRIVEFLNEQMSPAEVLAVEIKQYVDVGNNQVKVLVPRLVGQTVEAVDRKKMVVEVSCGMKNTWINL